MKKVLQVWVRKQETAVLSRMRGRDLDDLLSTDAWMGLTDFDLPMAGASKPHLRVAYEESIAATYERIGQKNPLGKAKSFRDRIEAALDKASMRFCRDTNRTTSLKIRVAREKLREELTAGLSRGEGLRKLTARVQAVFEDADKDRAKRIARTEMVRATNEAQVMAAKESGVVKGFRWQCSDGACQICLDIQAAAPTITLDEAFARLDDGPYGLIEHPPAHPGCYCWIEEILNG